jgi:hypothetical protein
MSQIHLPHELAAVRGQSYPEHRRMYLGAAQQEGRAQQVNQEEGVAIEVKNVLL